MRSLRFVEIRNAGPALLATNYWDLPEAQAGNFFLSTNAATFRLIVPDGHQASLNEMTTAKIVVVSRGPWPATGRTEALEILFDDGSANPYTLHMTIESCDRMPGALDAGRVITLTAWVRGHNGHPLLTGTWPCGYRVVPRIPCLEPWKSA